MSETPICPILGCVEPQCEPVVAYVCDDHHPRIDGESLRDWMIRLQSGRSELAARVERLTEALDAWTDERSHRLLDSLDRLRHSRDCPRSSLPANYDRGGEVMLMGACTCERDQIVASIYDWMSENTNRRHFLAALAATQVAAAPSGEVSDEQSALDALRCTVCGMKVCTEHASIETFPQMGTHFVSASCRDERCSICNAQATHKVGEEIMHDDPSPMRHNLTAYICCVHYELIMQTTCV